MLGSRGVAKLNIDWNEMPTDLQGKEEFLRNAVSEIMAYKERMDKEFEERERYLEKRPKKGAKNHARSMTPTSPARVSSARVHDTHYLNLISSRALIEYSPFLLMQV